MFLLRISISQIKGATFITSAQTDKRKPISKQVITGAIMLTEIIDIMAINNVTVK
jgi:hypothetical protein